MKLTALLLICSIVLLSSFSGRVKVTSAMSETDCCAKTKKHCTLKHEQKPTANTCENNGCSMLLTCSICGFLAVESVQVNAALSASIEKPFPTYHYGNSAVYLAKDWKPPKV